MTELALHLLDIARNSTRAQAKTVHISVIADRKKDELRLIIEDDGCGMDAELLARVTDPFATTRTTRKVGLGIPLFKQAAELTGGKLVITSEVGVGTTVVATFGLTHIDRVPLGDLGSTMVTLIGGSPDIDFILDYDEDGKRYTFTTTEVRRILDGVPLSEPEVLSYLTEVINENIENINGGQSI